MKIDNTFLIIFYFSILLKAVLAPFELIIPGFPLYYTELIENWGCDIILLLKGSFLKFKKIIDFLFWLMMQIYA